MANDEIKKTIFAKLEAIITDFANLEIKTVVGDGVTVERDTSDKEFTVILGEGSKAIASKVSLLDGDISTFFNSEFITGEYKELQAFHEKQITNGNDIITKNIKMLKDLAEWFKDK